MALAWRSVWEELGVASTRDTAIIRRAYAARLKVTHPEDDGPGFQRLREAYEQAIAWARRGGTGGVVRLAPDPEPREPEPPEPEPSDDERGDDDAAADGEPRGDDAPARPASPVRPVRVIHGAAPDAEPPPASPARPVRVIRGERTAGGDDEPIRARAPRIKPAPIRRAPPAGAASQAPEGGGDGRAEPVAAPAIDPDVLDHRRLCAALEGLLGQTGASDAARLAALQAVLASPAMRILAVNSQTEAWIAALLAVQPLKSAALFEAAVEHFGWDTHWMRAPSPQVLQVLARRDDARVLQALARRSDRSHDAFLALTRPRAGLNWLGDQLSVARTDKVEALLTHLAGKHPRLLTEEFFPNLGYWRDRLAKPGLGNLGKWLSLFGAVALTGLAAKWFHVGAPFRVLVFAAAVLTLLLNGALSLLARRTGLVSRARAAMAVARRKLAFKDHVYVVAGWIFTAAAVLPAKVAVALCEVGVTVALYLLFVGIPVSAVRNALRSSKRVLDYTQAFKFYGAIAVFLALTAALNAINI